FTEISTQDFSYRRVNAGSNSSDAHSIGDCSIERRFSESRIGINRVLSSTKVVNDCGGYAGNIFKLGTEIPLFKKPRHDSRRCFKPIGGTSGENEPVDCSCARQSPQELQFACGHCSSA